MRAASGESRRRAPKRMHGTCSCRTSGGVHLSSKADTTTVAGEVAVSVSAAMRGYGGQRGLERSCKTCSSLRKP